MGNKESIDHKEEAVVDDEVPVDDEVTRPMNQPQVALAADNATSFTPASSTGFSFGSKLNFDADGSRVYSNAVAEMKKTMGLLQVQRRGSPIIKQRSHFDKAQFEADVGELKVKEIVNIEWIMRTYRNVGDVQAAIKCLTQRMHQAVAQIETLQLDPLAVLTTHQVHQWITKVTGASSEYSPNNPNSWNRMCIRGPPTSYPKYGDLQTSWASAQSRGTWEFLEFKYDRPVYIIALDIFETYNPGCVVKILAHNGNEWVTIWQGQVDQLNLPEQSRIFTPRFPITQFKSNWIRVDLDCTNSRSWSEIDCVRLRGRDCYLWDPLYHKQFPVEFREIAFELLLVMQRLEVLPRDCVYEILRQLSLHYT